MTDLSGKRAIVTGGSRGVGLECARLLAQLGADVAFTGRSEGSVGRAHETLAGAGQVSAHAIDVRDRSAMAELMRAGCDILVNNAALGGGFSKLHETPAQEIAECLEVNLVSALLVARLAVTAMLKSGGGTIVNISSGAALRAVPQAVPYCVSKAGLAMATQGIHVEYAVKGIRCFGFQPGIVDTDMQAELQSSGLPPEVLPPLDIMVQPEEVARAVAWLCGPHADAYAGREFSIYDPDFRRAAGL